MVAGNLTAVGRYIFQVLLRQVIRLFKSAAGDPHPGRYGKVL